MVNKRFVTIAAACAVCAVLACGCNSSAPKSDQAAESSGAMQAPAAQTSAAVSAETSAAPEEPAYQTFGVQDAEGAAIELANKLDQPIVAVAVRATGDGEYAGNLIPEGVQMVPGEIAVIYLPKIEGTVSEESDIQTKAVADVRIQMADGAEYELHQVDVYDIAEADVRLSDGVAYLEYTSVSTGEPVSTLDAEIAWREAQQAPNEGTGDAAENSDAGYYEEPTYYEDTTYYEAPAGGGEDQCVPDIILR